MSDMDTYENPSTTEDDEEAVVNDDTNSVLGQLRQRYQEIQTTDYHMDLDIPGYGGLLVVRFVPHEVSRNTRKAMAMRKRIQENDQEVLLDSACDSIIDACGEVLIRRKPDQDPVSIDDESPIKFDQRLSELLQIDVGEPWRARTLVKNLFPTEQAILQMAYRVNEWLGDVTKESSELFLGE